MLHHWPYSLGGGGSSMPTSGNPLVLEAEGPGMRRSNAPRGGKRTAGGRGAGVRSPQGWPESGKKVTDLGTIISQWTIKTAVKTVL